MRLLRFARCEKVTVAALAPALGLCFTALQLQAQSCVTQAKMTQAQRDEIGAAAYQLATAVAGNDVNSVRNGTLPQYASDPNQAYLVRTTSEHIKGDTLQVTQAYLLDASTRKAGEGGDAEFTCPLAGTVAETDFAIPGLPPGRFAFVMVEARGPHPWLLAFLLQQEGTAWKMAGFYPRTRAAAGHDGLYYWSAARASAKASKPWLAWVQYSAADQLLRPASFLSSGNLDKLLTEQRTAAPQALTNGLSQQTPLAVAGAGGTVYQFTELRAQGSDDGSKLNLWLRLQGDPAITGTAATDRSLAAARALLAAHPELREGISDVWIVSETPGTNPITVQRPLNDLMAGSTP